MVDYAALDQRQGRRSLVDDPSYGYELLWASLEEVEILDLCDVVLRISQFEPFARI